MLGLGGRLVRGWAGNPAALNATAFAPTSLFAADFANGKYRNGTDYKTDITQLSGYSYTRSGAKYEVDPAGSATSLLYGPERLTNGDFSQGSTGWTVTGNDATHIATFAGGVLRYQSDTTTPILLIAQAGAYEVGKSYEVTVVVSSWTSGAVKVDASGVMSSNIGSVGTHTFRGFASATIFQIYRATADIDLTIESISVREVLGSTAVRPFAANVPGITSEGYWSRQAFTNRILYSRDLTNAVWNKRGTASVTTDGTVGADGGGLASKVVVGNGIGNDVYQQPLAGFTSGARVEPSLFIKKVSTTGVLKLGNPTDVSLGTWLIDLSLLSTGWERITRNHPAVTVSTEFTANPALRAGLHLYANSGGPLTFYVDFASQVEATTAGPVITTTSAVATVDEDNLPITLPTALTDQDMLIWARGTPASINGTQTVLSVYVSANERIRLQLVSGVLTAIVTVGGVAVYSQTVSGAITANTEFTACLRRVGGNWRVSKYVGTTLTSGTDAAGTFPTGLVKAIVGNESAGSTAFRGPIEAAQIIPGTFDTDAKVIAAVSAF